MKILANVTYMNCGKYSAKAFRDITLTSAPLFQTQFYTWILKMLLKKEQIHRTSEQNVCGRCRTCTMCNQRSVQKVSITVVGSVSSLRSQSRRSRAGWPHEFFRSVGWQSRWEKKYLLWNMYVVLSREMCHHGWASFRDLSFIWKMPEQKPASARLGANQSGSAGGGIIHLHWDVFGFHDAE